MSKGVVLIANNNSDIDYLLQAKFLTNRISHYLDLPVSVITDSPELISDADKKIFHNIIFNPSTNTTTKSYRDGNTATNYLEYKNTSRSSVYDLSPYDETLVLDTDMVVCNDLLKNCFNQVHDFLLYKTAIDLSITRSTTEFNFISDMGVDFYWATCVFFRKSQKNKIFFDLVKHIQENWNHYRMLYQISSNVFRNDFAFSIAVHIMNGFSSGDFAHQMPGKLYYTTDRDFLVNMSGDSLTALIEDTTKLNNFIPVRLNGITLHCMNKYSLNRVLEQ